jgi:hypothetical protein
MTIKVIQYLQKWIKNFAVSLGDLCSKSRTGEKCQIIHSQGAFSGSYRSLLRGAERWQPFVFRAAVVGCPKISSKTQNTDRSPLPNVLNAGIRIEVA